MTITKVLWIGSFSLIVAAGIVGVIIAPGNYPLPACINLLAGVCMGLALAVEGMQKQP